MSRFGDDYDEEFPGQGYLWAANQARQLHGKRGKAFLRELLGALEAMPVKELYEGYLVSPTGGTCAVGEVVIHRLMGQGMTRDEAVAKATAELKLSCTCYHGVEDHQGQIGSCTGTTAMWMRDERVACDCKAFQPEQVPSYESVDNAARFLGKLPRLAVDAAMYENDEGRWGMTAAERWEWVRAWAVAELAR